MSLAEPRKYGKPIHGLSHAFRIEDKQGEVNIRESSFTHILMVISSKNESTVKK